MASTVNSFTVVGRLGADAALRYGQTGTAIANLSIATSHRGKKKSGGEHEWLTEWHRVVVFGEDAKAIADAKKGDRILAIGPLRSSKYADKEGVERKAWEIRANTVAILRTKKKEEEDSGWEAEYERTTHHQDRS